MAFDNLGFETESSTTSGYPESWTVALTYAAEEAAAYDRGETPPDQPNPFEVFDYGWGVDDYIAAFDEPTNLLQVNGAVYDGVLPGGDEAVEDFEEAWDFNHFYIFSLESGDPAQYNSTPESVEPFESEWDANESFAFDWGDVTADAAQFDVTPESVEDFEEDWANNAHIEDWTGVTDDAAVFDDGVGGTPENVEDFEEVLFPFTVTALVGSDELVKASHGLSTGQIVTLSNTGGVLPGGLAPGVNYYVLVTSANEFQLAAISGGPALDITDTGTGVHTCTADGSVFWTLELTTV